MSCAHVGHSHTADFIKKVLSVYTHSMTTIYLSLVVQVAKSTFLMKSPVFKLKIVLAQYWVWVSVGFKNCDKNVF